MSAVQEVGEETGGALWARLKEFEGRPAVSGGRGRDPVNAPMIRHWCEAMGDANPAYTGPDAVAPPTMLQVWTMGGLSGHDRNQPAGASGSRTAARTGRTDAFDDLLRLLDEAGCTAVVATDCEQEYARPLRPGDDVAFDAVIESVSARKTTKLGAGYFVTTRMDVRVAGDLVGTHRFRILKYAPAAAAPPGRPVDRSVPHRPPSSLPSSASSPPLSPPRVPERRPRPVVNRDNAGFWEGVARHRLLIQRCTECRTLRFPWLPGCNACGSPDWTTVEATGEGTVHSYVVMHHPPFPAFDPPYVVGLIQLAEGVRIISNVVDVPAGEVHIGMPVRLEFQRCDEELVLPVFRGASATGAEAERQLPHGPVRAPQSGAGLSIGPGPGRPGGSPIPLPPRAPAAGAGLPPLEIPLTRTLIVAGAIASRDFQDVHHDPERAREKGAPDIFMNILTTNGLVGRYITDHFGPGAVLRRVAIRLGAPNHPGDTMVLTGTIEEVGPEPSPATDEPAAAGPAEDDPATGPPAVTGTCTGSDTGSGTSTGSDTGTSTGPDTGDGSGARAGSDRDRCTVTHTVRVRVVGTNTRGRHVTGTVTVELPAWSPWSEGGGGGRPR